MQIRTSLLALSLCLTVTAPAQSFQPDRTQKNLSPAALAKLTTLESLNALPAGEWRFHAGDLPHGESPTLDDASWPLVQPGSKAPQDAVWYRRTIEVPKTLNGYDISGERVLFQFRADANGPMPEIIYFNGRRVALGDDLEPIVLFEPAHPGDKILVAVKLLRTVDDKRFAGVSLTIQPAENKRPNPDDIRTQCLAAATLLPVLPTPRKDLLPKVEQAVAAIDLTALIHGDQQAFDQSLTKSQAILAELAPVLAQAKIDLAGNSHIDAAWLWPRTETVDVVKRTFTSALQLMNEYPDYTYTQSAAQYTEWMAEKYPKLNDQIRQRVKEGRWEIVGGMWVEPDLNLPDGESLVRQLLVGQRYFEQQYGVRARIGWNPDSFGYNWQLPQIYKRSGLDYFVTQKMHWNDTNILPFRLFWWQSPDGSKVLTYFPTDYVHDNVNPTRIAFDFAESAQRNPGTSEMLDLYGIGDHGGGPTRAMLDQADHWITTQPGAPSSMTVSSSSKVGRTGTQPGETGTQPGAPSSMTVSSSSKVGETTTQPGAPSSMTVSSSSKVGGTTTEARAIPTMQYHTAQHYFTDVETHLNLTSQTWNYDSIAKGYSIAPGPAGTISLPTWKDELYFEYHRGVQTTQAAHKRNIRAGEVATLDAEKLASLAWLYGEPYPAADLTESWKKITFNQFHDLAAGSGIGVIYKDAQRDFTEVFHSDREITAASFKTVAANVDTHDGTGLPVLVVNSLAWPRTEMVRFDAPLPEDNDNFTLFDARRGRMPKQVVAHDAANHTYSVLANVTVPAFGYTLLHVAPTPKGHVSDPRWSLQLSETPSAFTIYNSKVRLTIDRNTGCIDSLQLVDKNVEYLAPHACANQLQTYRDTPKEYDAWNIDPGTLDGPMTPIQQVDSIAITNNGPLRKTIRITRNWQQSHFIQDISLDADADFITVDNDIDWHETHVLLKAAFPLAASSGKATFEIPYGSIDRPTTRNNSWEKAKFEVPALRWADLGDEHQGVSILNDSKYGYDALGNTLRLTLLRSPTWPDPEADRGRQRFRYAIYPHTGTWKEADTMRRGYEFNYPLTAEQVFPHTGQLPAEHSFASVENRNVVLTAMKKAEDADALVFRIFEWAGTATDVKLHIPPGATYAVRTNLMEKVEGDHLPMTGDTITVPIKPYEILTVEAVYPRPALANATSH